MKKASKQRNPPVTFHGAFAAKEDATRKAASVPGAVVKKTKTGRYMVMSRNPQRRRKSKKGNPGELVILGLNPRRKKKAKVRARRRRKGNSALERAKQLYRKFHGREFGGVAELQREAKVRKDYAALGGIVAIGIDADKFDQINPHPDQVVQDWDKLPHLRFPKETTMLATSPDGKQLYLLGGEQDIDLERFETDSAKDLVDLGEATFVVYTARKAPSFEPVDWVHTFGEEGGTRPRLVYDRLNRELLFAGGSYHVAAPGIIN